LGADGWAQGRRFDSCHLEVGDASEYEPRPHRTRPAGYGLAAASRSVTSPTSWDAAWAKPQP